MFISPYVNYFNELTEINIDTFKLTNKNCLLVSRSTFSNLGRSLPAIISFGSDFQQLHQLLYIRIEILYVRAKDLLCIGLVQESEGEAKK